MKKILLVDNVRFLNRGPYSFELYEKQIMGLSGISGSGKTLLLRALCDLEESEGNIYLREKEKNEMNAVEWRKSVAWLPAESLWWQNTAIEHFKNKPENHLLKTLNIDEQILNFEISRLSTGERQRLAILRILQNRPSVLLLDEPTASLDPENIKAVEKIILNYIEENNSCAIWIGHDVEQIKRMATFKFEMFQDGEMRKSE